MRLENDAANRSKSPPQSYRHGTSRSPISKPHSAKIANGDTAPRNETNGAYSNGNSIPTRAHLSKDFDGHSREEVTRIIIQGLTDLGYHDSARALSDESGYQLEGPTVASFKKAVLQGDWVEAEALLFGTDSYSHGGGVGLDMGSHDKSWVRNSRSRSPSQHTGGLPLAEGANRSEMLFWIRQQKYLEALERRDIGKALMVLRQELAPLNQDVTRLHALSGLMMCPSAQELRQQAEWDGEKGTSRTQLLSALNKYISPSVMIPERRLTNLLHEVKQSWIGNCLYHNTAASPSLYVDHTCDRSDFPSKPALELNRHRNEVWFLKYSHNGNMLASGSRDSSVIIYDTTSPTYKVLHELKEHQAGITYLAWSPDDTKLVTCSRERENVAKIWDTRTGRLISTLNEFTYPCTTASFTPDGKNVIIGSQDTHYGLAIWDLEGNLVRKPDEEGARVNDIAVSPDGRRLVVLLDHRILVYDLPSLERIYEWPADGDKLTSVNISSQHPNLMLVSMSDDRIKLIEIDTGYCIQTYMAHSQRQFIIRSCFGGANEAFVVSGSEDSRVYIWRINGHLVAALDGHSDGCVNAVAWHPTNPREFASAGDDHKVRIWKPSSSSGGSGLSNGR